MKSQIIFLLCIVSLTLFGIATSPTRADEPHKMIVQAAGAPAPGEADRLVFISSEFELQKFVKGAPYSAQSVTERVQELADGNRITQKNTANVFRDSEGRTRREMDLALIGPWTASSAEPPHTIFIHDPVAGVDYILDEKEKTARKLKIVTSIKELPSVKGGKETDTEEDFELPVPPPHGGGENHVFQFYNETEKGKKESLGKQIMEGINVEGARTTSTIPTGKIGNDRPIEIVSEKWYSPELQLNIMTRHSDPRFGETTYRLTNINRTEPDPSLFRVPDGYKLTESKGGERIFIRKEIQEKN